MAIAIDLEFKSQFKRPRRNARIKITDAGAWEFGINVGSDLETPALGQECDGKTRTEKEAIIGKS
jgi:hypothetical protein